MCVILCSYSSGVVHILHNHLSVGEGSLKMVVAMGAAKCHIGDGEMVGVENRPFLTTLYMSDPLNLCVDFMRLCIEEKAHSYLQDLSVITRCCALS